MEEELPGRMLSITQILMYFRIFGFRIHYVMANEDLMYSAFQRFYGALQSIDAFSFERDLIDNVSSLDNFFSSFRSTTFVLQNSVSHTDFKQTYENLCDKYLQDNPICKWMVTTRNEIEKQHPFDLEKEVFVTVYSPVLATVMKSIVFTVENDVEYKTLVSSLKNSLSKINSVEIHFSLEFKFRKANDDRNLYKDITSAIQQMTGLLMEMYETIGEPSRLCDDLKEKIMDLESKFSQAEIFFVDDYVYYPPDDKFERGERYLPILPQMNLDVKEIAKRCGAEYPSYDSKEFYKMLAILHLEVYRKQKGNLMPAIFVVDRDNKCSIVTFNATIRTTMYRKVNEIADSVIANDVKYVVLISLAYNYKDFSSHNLPYFKRTQYSTNELLLVQQVGEGFVPRTMQFDVRRINDSQYVKDVLKNSYNNKLIIQKSVLYPIYLAIQKRKNLERY